MNMKYSTLLFLTAAALTLAACSSKQDTGGSSQEQAASSSPTSSQSSENNSEDNKEQVSKNPEVENVDKTVSYNGSYYSVAGKYDEIVIANKHYPLSPSYNPGENATAKSELLKLIADMQAQGYAISDQYSGFRSYDSQTGLYQNYVNQDGKEAADRYSARPGYSEHQTGLAFDLIDSSGNLVQEAGASQWLLDNAYKYGFIVRYQAGKEASTGYMPESWHLRYIGKEAKEISDSGLSLEEYYGFTGGDYTE
ncbi:D-alanyl-D-alanine carboxypeptidase [Streptococcus sp. DD11]|uniref:LD-carboxypeptidase LdcB/DacB n=1 Tax=Streptococcus sp. DD11 TaxID=1777879 RepID=UPI00079C619E|nr:LD-carboxypeptidase LdcB/DacB [Streptococcus sp. DD11]KXT78363.1 D-alanyl-D-alanine carboxypeptidase [Streptococcus sp. DD11]